MTAKQGLDKWYEFLRKCGKTTLTFNLNDVMAWEKDQSSTVVRVTH